MKINYLLAVLVAGIGFMVMPSATAQFQQFEENQTNQTENMTQLMGQDAILLHDEAGEYMVITLNDQGELLGTAGTVLSIDELEDESLTVCIYEDEVNQDFIDIFQPEEGFFEGEIMGDSLTDEEVQQIADTANCYDSGNGGGIFS